MMERAFDALDSYGWYLVHGINEKIPIFIGISILVLELIINLSHNITIPISCPEIIKRIVIKIDVAHVSAFWLMAKIGKLFIRQTEM